MTTARPRAVLCAAAAFAAMCAPCDRVHADHAEQRKRTGYRIIPVPLFDFDTDRGLGYGTRLALFDYGHNQKPYRYKLTLQLFRTTRGINAHRLIFDLPWVRGSRWRFDASLHFVTDFTASWYGLGAAAEPVPAYVQCDDRSALEIDPDTCPDNPLFRGLYYYNYKAVHPWGAINARRQLDGPWQAMAGYKLRYAIINTHYPDHLGQTGDSLLLEDLATGDDIVGLYIDENGDAATTRTAELSAGIVYDTRDIEASPTSGYWHEASLRVATPLVGGQFWYMGAHINLRAYRSLDAHSRLILVGRFVLDILGGDVPFYQLNRTGGLSPFSMLGGSGSLRGLGYNRYAGKIKTLFNAELRTRAYSLWWRESRIDLGGLIGLDTGRVWREFLSSDGPLLSMPFALVAGFRGIYDDSFVVRIDYGYEFSDGTSGVYLSFNHMF